MKIHILILIMLLSVGIKANQQDTDSLIIATTITEGKDRVQAYINLTRHYFVNRDTLATETARKAIDQANQINDRQGAGQAMLFLGLSFAGSNPDSALKYYILSSEILSELNHPWSHYGYKNAADIYINRAWYPEALKYSLLILDINEQTGDKNTMTESLSTLGHLYYNTGDYANALNWQRKALEIAKGIDDSTRLGLILGRIGVIYDEMGAYDSAFYYNQQAIGIFRKVNDQDYSAQWLSNIANTHLKLNNLTEAEKYLLNALEYNMQNDVKTIILTNLGKIYIDTKRFSLAENALDSACVLAHQFQQKKFLSEVWFRIYELNLAKGNIPEALNHYIKYSELRDSLFNITKSDQLAQMQVRYDTEKKEKELISERAERYKAQLTASVRQRWIWGISLSAALLISFVLIAFQRHKRKSQQEKDAAIIAEKERGLAAIINAQEDERKRVAKDLHDGVGQQLSALNLNFQALSKRILEITHVLEPDIERIKNLILEAGSDIRTVSHQMMPRALTEFGLIDALEDMIGKSFSRSGIECTFKHSNIKNRFPLNIEIGLYRITQELINNIIKHANASCVNISLTKTQTHCILIVADNGKGLTNSQPHGSGLQNMNSRIIALRGEFNLESKPGQGTTATIKIML